MLGETLGREIGAEVFPAELDLSGNGDAPRDTPAFARFDFLNTGEFPMKPPRRSSADLVTGILGPDLGLWLKRLLLVVNEPGNDVCDTEVFVGLRGRFGRRGAMLCGPAAPGFAVWCTIPSAGSHFIVSRMVH